MLKTRILIFVIIIALLAAIGFVVVGDFNKNNLSSLHIETNPSMEVFIDNKSVGKTPYDGTNESKKVTIRIGTYEAQVYLQPGIKTVVNRTFVADTDQSYGALLSFEKTNLSNATLAIVTDPSTASVNIDGKMYGNTPLSISELSSGHHKLDVSLNGYSEKSFSVNIINGYKLISSIDLQPSTVLSAATKKEDLVSVAVRILSTPTGFLRVRLEPTTASSEIARVHTGEEYPLKSVDNKSGWYEISLDATSSGWISNVYAATSSSTLVKN